MTIPQTNDSQTLQLDEVRDVHPIFRANPFLIEEGLSLVRGEKYFSNESLKHIDLLFEDKAGVPTFVEVKWSDVSEHQMAEYKRLIELHSPGRRLVWAVPDDLIGKASPASKYNIQVKSFNRGRIITIKKLQIEADTCLSEINRLLTESFKITMHGEPIPFENPITACYFEGRATTDKGGRKKLGLKQQSVGRQLDLVKNISTGHIAELHKEKIPVLIWEVFKAPYSYKPGKLWRIMDGGLIELIEERQDRSLERLVLKIWELANDYYNKYYNTLRSAYNNDITKYDITALSLFALSGRKGKLVFSIDELIGFIIDEFEIKPTSPIPRIKHGILNQWIENIVSAEKFENDMAKRLLEIAILKRMLMPKMGIAEMWILSPSRKNDKLIAQRQPCQMFSFNKDAELYLAIEQYHQEGG